MGRISIRTSFIGLLTVVEVLLVYCFVHHQMGPKVVLPLMARKEFGVGYSGDGVGFINFG